MGNKEVEINKSTSTNFKEHVKNMPFETTENVEEILQEISSKADPIDFRLKVYSNRKRLQERLNENISSDQKEEIKMLLKDQTIRRKHYLIITINSLFELCEDLGYGLCKRNDRVHIYTKTHWKTVDKEKFKAFLLEVSLCFKVPYFEAKLHKFQEELYKQFAVSAYMATNQCGFNTVKINLNNGTYKITNGEGQLGRYDKKDFMQYKLDFSFFEGAAAPKFQAFLDTVLPEEDKQLILAEYIGYLFIKNGSKLLKQEKVLLLYGSGANGKSVLFEILFALLGKDNVTNFSLQNLTSDIGYYRAQIDGKLLNYASEINQKLNAAQFKQLASGEPIEARLPYGAPFTIDDYAKFIFNANELPKEIEHTHAFFRRFIILPFEVTIPEDKQDKHLAEKIIGSELAGVFNWALNGLSRLLKQKSFTKSISVERAVEQFKTQTNSVLLFLQDEGYEQNSKEYTLQETLYSEYFEYCKSSGLSPFNKKNFDNQITRKGIRKDRAPGLGKTCYYLKN